ncbi:FoF1 ATP synthase subunit delta/epsilon [Blattabacterium cuenoti]|uniref:FoF1 ATP synthase subunit delta/epsilon n=1 Tax=Blattabacterium cuenoti TaxID=1653831 RepID=UPI00163D2EE8|nr:F0F1 ATP synthase subunit epsilon [Blattabacterium cuenoti]
MKIKIINDQQLLYKNHVKSVILPGEYGSFQLLKNHAPLIAILKTGLIKIIQLYDHKQVELQILYGGILKIYNNYIIILL